MIEYDDSFYESFFVLFHDYWLEVHDEDLNRLIHLESGPMNELKAQLLVYLELDRCKIRLAKLGQKIVGFMIYHYLFDSILIVRGIYFMPEYRKRTWLRKLTLSVGTVKRVLSQTYTDRPPKEINGQKKNRKLIHKTDRFEVWENIVRG